MRKHQADPLEVLSDAALSIAEDKERVAERDKQLQAGVKEIVGQVTGTLQKVEEITKVAQGGDETAKKLVEKKKLEKRLKEIEGSNHE